MASPERGEGHQARLGEGIVMAVDTMIPPWFRRQMARLSGLKFAPVDLTTHWEHLRDMPEALLRVAVDRAQGATDEFPSPRMLRSYGEQDRARAFPIAPEEDSGTPLDEPVVLGTLPTGKPIVAEREWKYYCQACGDTGWKSWWCGERQDNRQPWMDSGRCGRNKAHLPHEWLAECSCADGNPSVQRKSEKWAQGPRRGSRDSE